MTICFLMMSLMSVHAGNTQTLTINGQTVDKAVTQMTFDGDNVVLHFADNSTQTSDMSAVTLSFTSATGIDAVHAFQYNGVVGDELSLDGIAAGTVIAIYDASGKQQYAATAQNTSVRINVAGMQKGLYLLKAGKQVVKFVKR